MKDGFEEIEHEFPFLSVEHSVGNKQDYLLGCFSLGPGSALGEKEKKLASEASWLQTTAGIDLLADICPVCPGFFPSLPGALSHARDVLLFPYGKF